MCVAKRRTCQSRESGIGSSGGGGGGSGVCYDCYPTLTAICCWGLENDHSTVSHLERYMVSSLCC